MTKCKSKIKKGDEIIVIAGKDKGKQGSVLKVHRMPSGRVKVLVEGVNIVKKHVKPNPQANQQGGIQEREALIDISNVMIFNSATKKGDRIGFRILDNGTKVRVFRSTGENINID